MLNPSATASNGNSHAAAVAALSEGIDVDVSTANPRRKKSKHILFFILLLVKGALKSLFAGPAEEDDTSPIPDKRIAKCYLYTVAAVSYILSQMWTLVVANEAPPVRSTSIIANQNSSKRASSPAPSLGSRTCSTGPLSFSRVDMCEVELLFLFVHANVCV